MNNKLTFVSFFIALSVSTTAQATGGKGGDPEPNGRAINTISIFNSTGGKGGDPFITFDSTGGKGGDPVVTLNSTGGKGGDPSNGQGRTGGKGGDPKGRVLATDSGYPTLMALLSKYFSI